MEYNGEEWISDKKRAVLGSRDPYHLVSPKVQTIILS